MKVALWGDARLNQRWAVCRALERIHSKTPIEVVFSYLTLPTYHLAVHARDWAVTRGIRYKVVGEGFETPDLCVVVDSPDVASHCARNAIAWVDL